MATYNSYEDRPTVAGPCPGYAVAWSIPHREDREAEVSSGMLPLFGFLGLLARCHVIQWDRSWSKLSRSSPKQMDTGFLLFLQVSETHTLGILS